MYTVFWVAGKRDGQELGNFETEREAIKFAKEFLNEHEEEFDPVCGGVAIADGDGKIIEW